MYVCEKTYVVPMGVFATDRYGLDTSETSWTMAQYYPPSLLYYYVLIKVRACVNGNLISITAYVLSSHLLVFELHRYVDKKNQKTPQYARVCQIYITNFKRTNTNPADQLVFISSFLLSANGNIWIFPKSHESFGGHQITRVVLCIWVSPPLLNAHLKPPLCPRVESTQRLHFALPINTPLKYVADNGRPMLTIIVSSSYHKGFRVIPGIKKQNAPPLLSNPGHRRDVQSTSCQSLHISKLIDHHRHS